MAPLKHAVAILAFGLHVASVPLCHAQGHLALGVGPSVPVGDLGDGSTFGVHGVATVFFGSTAQVVNGRLDLTASRFFADRSGQNSSTNIFAVNLGVIVAAGVGRPTRPYFTAGMGVYRTPPDCPSRTNVGLNGGVGVRFPRVLIESRFHLVYTGCNSLFHIPLTVALVL